MDAKTTEALEASIEKWKENLRQAEDGRWGHLRVASGDCPLCELFFRFGLCEPCDGCPVKERTGKDHCEDTPYSNVVAEIGYCNRTDCAGQPAPLAPLIAAVKAEVEFLESLREPPL